MKTYWEDLGEYLAFVRGGEMGVVEYNISKELTEELNKQIEKSLQPKPICENQITSIPWKFKKKIGNPRKNSGRIICRGWKT